MSSIELLAKYLGQRARPLVFVPLAFLVAETAWLAAPGRNRTAAAFALCAAQALLLVLSLRVWDDVQDRARDAVRHPERMTVRARRTAPFTALSLSLAAMGVFPLLGATVPLARAAILATIGAVLLLWYRTRPAEPSRLSGAVLLAKYPALAIALAPGLGEVTPARATAAAGTLYVIACTYEYLEDRHRGIS